MYSKIRLQLLFGGAIVTSTLIVSVKEFIASPESKKISVVNSGYEFT